MGVVHSDDCTPCHQEIGAEWGISLHRNAWIDPLFQEGYLVEKKGFCRKCHAPESSPAREPNRAAIREGVGCTTCHVMGGFVIGARANGRQGSHETRSATWMRTEKACAGCHQFRFPAYSNQAEPALMQSTVNEWRSSRFASVPCPQCHMPEVVSSTGRRHRNHRFHIQGNEGALRRAVKATARRFGRFSVRVQLRAGAVGHAFPTGDLFRRLEVRVWAVDSTGRVVSRPKPQRLERTYRDVRYADGTVARLPTADTRLGPPGTPTAERTLVFSMPRYEIRATTRWQVVYQRVGTGLFREVEDETVLAEGVL